MDIAMFIEPSNHTGGVARSVTWLEETARERASPRCCFTAYDLESS